MKNVYLTAGMGVRPAAMAQFCKAVYSECDHRPPKVAYIGTASDDDLGFYEEMRDDLVAGGASSVELVLLAHAHADVAAAKQQLAACDAIFVSGGDVFAGMQWLNRYQLAPYLRELAAQGKVFFGMSAGAIMLGKQWINWPDSDPDGPGELFDCLGIAPACFDAHAEADDWVELRSLLKLQGPGASGHGLTRGCCLRISPQGVITLIGAKAPIDLQYPA